MKAYVYAGRKKIQFKNIPKPSPAPDEVLLKVRSVGICGTDLHIYNGGTDVKSGSVLGHEFSGEIVALGKQVTNLKVGDRAVAEHVVTCQKCFYCLRGKPNLCLKASVIGLQQPGALAEYMVIPARLVYAFPKSISFDEAALIEPLTIALYAAAQAGFLLEKRVAVIGQGPIGLLLDQVLEAAGAHVIGIDVMPERLAFAQKQGWIAQGLNASAKNFPVEQKKLSAIGVDASFEAVGKETTANLAFDLTRRDGQVFLLGVFEKPATIDIMRLIKKELHLHGSWTCAFSFPASIDMVKDKKIDLKSLITHVVDFADAPRAFEQASAYSDKRIKTIIRVS